MGKTSNSPILKFKKTLSPPLLQQWTTALLSKVNPRTIKIQCYTVYWYNLNMNGHIGHIKWFSLHKVSGENVVSRLCMLRANIHVISETSNQLHVVEEMQGKNDENNPTSPPSPNIFHSSSLKYYHTLIRIDTAYERLYSVNLLFHISSTETF